MCVADWALKCGPIPAFLLPMFGVELCEDTRCELAAEHAPYWHAKTEDGLVISTWAATFWEE